MDSKLKFGGKYLLSQEIANGGCGTVFLGTHHIAGKPVAIKLEPAQSSSSATGASRVVRKSKSQPDFMKGPYAGASPLTTESQIYKRLMGGPGVPFLMYSGKQGDYNVMVIDLLGPSLEDLFKMCNRSFSLKTVLMLADQCLERIAYVHGHSLLHRDIKPANFVMGRQSTSSSPSLVDPDTRPRPPESTVNIIDFGLAKKYRDPVTGEHVPYTQSADGLHGVGTSLFASLNTHLGIESSRRDDLESLAYMLVYFLRGTLPWRKLRAPANPPTGVEPSIYNPVTHTWNIIRDAKLKVEAEDSLCKGLPEEFGVLYHYARTLSFTDLPDYDGLRALFRGLAIRAGCLGPAKSPSSSSSSCMDLEYDYAFDWTVPAEKPSAKGNHVHVPFKETPVYLSGGGRFCEACNKRAAELAGVGSMKRRR